MESFQLDQASNELGLQADLDTLFVAPAPPCPAILPGGDSLPIFRGATGSGLAGPTGLGPAPPPSAVAAAFAAARPLPAQSAPASAAPSSQQKDPTDVERKAIAREKNRMAQRRFREKERARIAEVQHRADSLGREMERLRLENAELAHWQQLMEKTLAVRNAMLALMNQLEPSALGQQQAGQSDKGGLIGGDSGKRLVAASTALAQAVGQLPPTEELQTMLEQLGSSEGGSGGDDDASRAASPQGAAPPPSPPGGQQASRPSAQHHQQQPPLEDAGAGPGVEGVDVDEPPVRLADVVAASASSSRAAEPLMEVGAPAPDKPDLRSRVEGIVAADQLEAAWREHKERMRGAYAAGERARFAPGCEALAELEAQIGSLAELFWYAAQLRPRIFKSFILACLPPREADTSGHWRRVAQQSMAIASEEEICALRRAWQRYMRRATVAAVRASPWASRLQEVVCRGPAGALADTSSRFLRVSEVARQLAAACDEQYAAVMGFLADIGRHVSARLRVFWQLAAEEFLPDHPAIISEILRLHQQQLLPAASDAGAEGAALPPPPPAPGGGTRLAAWAPPLLPRG